MRSTLLLLISLAAAASQADAQQLEHSAPWLGSNLELELTGLPPGAPYWLFGSTAKLALPTPYGLLAVDPQNGFPLASGAADGTGSAAVSLPIPAMANLADLPLYIQGLYADATLPAGAALVPARDLALLGSRVYTVRVYSETVPYVYTFEARAGHSLDLLFELPLPFGGVGTTGPVVLSADGSRGAAATSSGLLRFDNFFGADATVGGVAAPSGDPVARAGGEAFLVMGGAMPSTVLHLVPFDPALSSQALFPLLSPHFAYDAQSDAVWVQSTSPTPGVLRLHLVDVPAGAVLREVDVRGTSLAFLEFADGNLFAGVRGPLAMSVTQSLAVVDTTQAVLSATVFNLPAGVQLRSFGADKDTGRLAIATTSPASIPFFSTALFLIDTATPLAQGPVGIAIPNPVYGILDLVQSSAGIFFLDAAPESAFQIPPLLYTVDVAQAVATAVASVDPEFSRTLAVVADFTGAQVVMPAFCPISACANVPAYTYDPVGDVAGTVNLNEDRVTIHALSIP